MRDTVDSIKEYGVLVPAIVRPCEDGGYAKKLYGGKYDLLMGELHHELGLIFFILLPSTSPIADALAFLLSLSIWLYIFAVLPMSLCSDQL